MLRAAPLILPTKADRFALIRPSDMIPGRPKIKMHDKLAALQMLGRHLLLFRESLETPGNLVNDVDADGVREIILAALPALLREPQRTTMLKGLTTEQLSTMLWDWRTWVRPNQIAPPGD
jgi:hypothetical protein